MGYARFSCKNHVSIGSASWSSLHLCDISRLLLLVISNHLFSKISFFCVFSLVCFLHTFNLISIPLLRIPPQKITVAWMSLPCIVTWNELPVSHNSLLLYIFGAITTNAFTLESCYLMLLVDMHTKREISTACMQIYRRAHFSCEMTKHCQKMASSTTDQKMPYIV